MKYAVVSLVFAVLLVYAPVSVSALENAGFVNGLWFSQNPVTDFGNTDIFTIIHNEGDDSLKGIATLFVNDVAIGARDVVLAQGGIKKLTFSYEFSEGVNDIRATFTPANGSELTSATLGATTVRVVRDTDGDGIQDTTDNDDDNDGIADESDPRPLIFDEMPKPEQELSEGGFAMWKRLTNATTTPDAATNTPTNPVVGTVRTLEGLRKRGAETFRVYEEEQRAKASVFEGAVASSTAMGLSPQEEGKKREHQLAAAGAAWLHFVFDEEIMFYIHVVVLILSVLHFVWGWFKKWFNKKEADDDEWEE